MINSPRVPNHTNFAKHYSNFTLIYKALQLQGYTIYHTAQQNTLSISRRHECGTWSLFCTDVPNTTSPEGTCLCKITRSGRRNSWDRRSIKSVLLTSFMILKIIVINKIKFWKCYTFHAYYEWKGGLHDFDKILLLKHTEMDWNGSPNISKCAAILFPIGQTRPKYCFGINWIVIHFISF